MILADTSVWVDHFRAANPEILRLTEADLLVIHPYVIGELSMGQFVDRVRTLGALRELVLLFPLRHSEIMALVETRQLYGTGLQYVDAHLLGSVLATQGCQLWTRDKRLRRVAEHLDVAANLA